MIHLTCTKCRARLEIDDAFAGGVCRCQHCGTIQTVPAHAKDRAGATQPVAGSKAIYHRGGKSPDASDSLDELAGAVASSGLSGSGLTSRRLTRRPPSDTEEKSSMKLIFALVGGVILVLVIVIIWLVTRSSSSASNNAGQQELTPHAAPTPTPAPVLTGPNFC